MATVPEPRAPKPGDHLFLVDGSSYIFRAYHALPPLNRKSDGLQINAVLGFCNMLWKLMRDLDPQERPTHLAVIFDKSEQTFRNEFYPAYKAHRPEAPSDLVPQFAYIREAVRAVRAARVRPRPLLVRECSCIPAPEVPQWQLTNMFRR